MINSPPPPESQPINRSFQVKNTLLAGLFIILIILTMLLTHLINFENNYFQPDWRGKKSNIDVTRQG